MGLQLDPHYRLPKMRYKGSTADDAAPPPMRVRVEGAPSGGGGPGATAASAAGGGSASGGGSGGKGRPLIAEVTPGGSGKGDEAPSFALLASKRQQRQNPAAAAAAAAKAPPAAAAAAGPAKQQAAQLQPQVEYRGTPAASVCITLPLPAAAAAAAARDPASIAASVCGEAVRVQVPGCQPAEVQLPFAVSAEGGTAQLRPASGGGSSAGASLVLDLPYRPFSSVLQELRQAAGAAEGGAGPGSSLMDLD